MQSIGNSHASARQGRACNEAFVLSIHPIVPKAFAIGLMTLQKTQKKINVEKINVQQFARSRCRLDTMCDSTYSRGPPQFQERFRKENRSWLIRTTCLSSILRWLRS